MKRILLMCLFVLLGLSGCKTVSDPQIKVYTRDTTSGTRDGFFTAINMKSAVSDNSTLANGYVELASNGDIINAIKNDIYGIGYISLASLESSTLKGLTYEGVTPTQEHVLDGTYELTRNFNYIKRANYSSPRVQAIVEAFIAYLSTTEGKATIQSKDGIVEILPTDSSWNDIKSQYPICLQDNSDLTIHFGGSTSVEKVAKALSAEFSLKCGNFVAEHAHTGSGDAYKRTQGSEQEGANALDIGFSSRDFKLQDTEQAVEGTYETLCIDAIVVVVHSSNQISSITQADLQNIYLGQITTWKELN